MNNKFNWTDEIKQYIFDNYVGVGPSEMAVKVSEQFKVECTRNLVKGFYARNHLNSGITGYFQKGKVSHNKSKKQSDYMSPEAVERTKATRFKSGQLPHNTKPIGYERVTKDGYVEVKVRMRPDRKNHIKNFIGKHIIVWERHNGPVPKGMCLRFLDGNKQNCSIENLQLVSRAEHLQLTRSGYGNSKNPEITKTGIALAKLNVAMRKREHEEK